jgi:hypothetical protein
MTAERFEIVSVEAERVSHPPLPFPVLSAYRGPRGPLFIGYSDDDRRTHVAGDDGAETVVPWGPGRTYLEEGAYNAAASGLPVTGRLEGTATLEFVGPRKRRRRLTLSSGSQSWWMETTFRNSGALRRGPDGAVIANLGSDTIEAEAGDDDVLAATLFWACLRAMLRKTMIPQLPTLGSAGP